MNWGEKKRVKPAGTTWNLSPSFLWFSVLTNAKDDIKERLTPAKESHYDLTQDLRKLEEDIPMEAG